MNEFEQNQAPSVSEKATEVVETEVPENDAALDVTMGDMETDLPAALLHAIMQIESSGTCTAIR